MYADKAQYYKEKELNAEKDGHSRAKGTHITQ